MGWLSGKPRHSSGETSGQDAVRKHGKPARRIVPGKACRCGSGISENVCHCRKLGSGRDRIGNGTYRNGRKVSGDKSRKWGR